MAMTKMKMDDKRLVELRNLLVGRKLTAFEIAARVGCTKATAYNRLQALKDYGCKILVGHIREGEKGPLSRQFWIARRRPRRRK